MVYERISALSVDGKGLRILAIYQMADQLIAVIKENEDCGQKSPVRGQEIGMRVPVENCMDISVYYIGEETHIQCDHPVTLVSNLAEIPSWLKANCLYVHSYTESLEAANLEKYRALYEAQNVIYDELAKKEKNSRQYLDLRDRFHAISREIVELSRVHQAMINEENPWLPYIKAGLAAMGLFAFAGIVSRQGGIVASLLADDLRSNEHHGLS